MGKYFKFNSIHYFQFLFNYFSLLNYYFSDYFILYRLFIYFENYFIKFTKLHYLNHLTINLQSKSTLYFITPFHFLN